MFVVLEGEKWNIVCQCLYIKVPNNKVSQQYHQSPHVIRVILNIGYGRSNVLRGKNDSGVKEGLNQLPNSVIWRAPYTEQGSFLVFRTSELRYSHLHD